MAGDEGTNRELRTAVRAFVALATAFGTLGVGLLGVHGFTGMHDASASEALEAEPVPDDDAAAVAPTTTTSTTAIPDGPFVVEVVMDEFSYAPRRVEVPAGRPVVFEVVNVGAVDHELVIGDEHAQDEAEREMASGEVAAGHSHEGRVPSLYLEPGERGTLEATFDEPGTLLLGCHVPGHWAAGMKGFLDIEA